MTNRQSFYTKIRPLFGGQLKQSQVDGIDLILDRAGDDYDKRKIAYIFATVFHEVAKTMQPIREWDRGKNYPYGKADVATGQTYYGRGFVQLTWKANYRKASKELGIDFLNNPDLVMETQNAVEILFAGMEQGWFTGKRLSDYINEHRTDYVNARKIINGTDRAELIAGYAEKFFQALS